MTSNASEGSAGENSQHQSPKLEKNATSGPGWVAQVPWSGKRSKYGSPFKAIRRHCVECSGDNEQEVKHCPSSTCLLWAYRFGQMSQTAIAKGKPADPDLAPVKPLRDGPVWPVKQDGTYISPLRMVRGYCLNCTGTWHDVEYCEITDCPLCGWRFGIMPETAATRGRVVDRETLDWLRQWEDKRPPNARFFTTLQGKPLDARYIRQVVDRCAEKVGLDRKRVSPHVLLAACRNTSETAANSRVGVKGSGHKLVLSAGSQMVLRQGRELAESQRASGLRCPQRADHCGEGHGR